ncbi:MAG: ABC transporter ATP-binding protein [Lachnospiraceae bacterium]|nr:ABC transporter ATP-binding protein [Lachnospiraceae bacterium]
MLFMLATILVTVLQVFLELKLPDYMNAITTTVITPGSYMSDIWIAGGMMLLCSFGGLIASVFVGFFCAKVATGFSMRLRSQVYDKVTGFSMEEINGFSTASLITRSTNDIMHVQMFLVMGTAIMFRAIIMASMAIGKIYSKSWQWTLSTAIAVLLLLLLIISLIIVVLPKFKIIQTLTDNLNRVTRENLTGIRVVRAYNAEDFQEGKFEEANDELMKTHLFTQRAMAIMGPGMSIIMNGLSLAVYWIGAYLINIAPMPVNVAEAVLSGEMSFMDALTEPVADKIAVFSDMVVFSSYAMQVVMSFMMLTMIFIILPRASVSAKRIKEVLDTKTKITDGTVGGDSDKADKSEKPHEVIFDHVSFRYPDASDAVLEDISFTAKAGETVAFIGSTGSGKSTLINLVPRFYDVTEGRILIDGVDVRDYTRVALRNRIGLVPQRAVLFGGTIRSNIAYGDNGKQEEYTDEEIWDALRIAQAEDFVSKLDSKLDADVAQGGTNFSGGQKQRLSIARAVCRKPDIYIFDDSFSALDYKTDRILRGELKKVTGDAITLLVAQRIGTILDADRIIVLDDGRMAGMGTHKELMETCEVYRQIAYSQLSKEELA